MHPKRNNKLSHQLRLNCFRLCFGSDCSMRCIITKYLSPGSVQHVRLAGWMLGKKFERSRWEARRLMMGGGKAWGKTEALKPWRLKAEDSWLELKPGPHFLCHPISHWLGNGGYFGFIYNDMWSYYIMQWNTNSQHHRSVPSGALDSVWWFLVWDFDFYSRCTLAWVFGSIIWIIGGMHQTFESDVVGCICIKVL